MATFSSAPTEELGSHPDQRIGSCAGANCERGPESNEGAGPSSAVQSGDAVCMDLLQDRVDRFAFNHMHALPSRSRGDYDFFINPGLAKADINNDGPLHNVIQGYVTVHDYDAEVLAVTDDSRTTIPKNALNDLLTAGPGGVLADGSFPSKTSIFSRERVVYIETEILGSGEDDDQAHVRLIYVIRGNRAQKVCTIDGAFISKKHQNKMPAHE
jgi:hypothetical protein